VRVHWGGGGVSGAPYAAGTVVRFARSHVSGTSRARVIALGCRMRDAARRRPGPLAMVRGATLLSGIVTACLGNLDPCPGVHKGSAVEIEVLGVGDSELGCQESYGLAPGALVQGTIDQVRGDHDCKSGVPKIQSVAEWSWVRNEAAGIGGGYTLEGRYIISKGECSASLWLLLLDDPPLACDARRGERCRLQVRIIPSPGSEATCPDLCGAEFDVRAQSL
jgi:hypothetical protein